MRNTKPETAQRAFYIAFDCGFRRKISDLKKRNRRGIKNNVQYIGFANEIADILGIDPPEIVTGEMQTPTMLAFYEPDKNRLTIRAEYTLPTDGYFSIAHELRHVWQMRYMPEAFEKYANSQQIDIDAYNRQLAEIDANAFAAAVMAEYFGVAPTFDNLPDDIVKMIYDRADKLFR